MQIHGALLALHTKRPVKIVYNQEESFFGHVHRHPARIWCEHRATRAGELVNVQMRILLDGGAYASSSTAVTSNAACFAIGPYKVANALIESTCVYTNNPPCGAMRGFGAVQTCFAAEAQMDKLAEELGIDPVELRLLNALGSGDTLPTGQVIEGVLPTARSSAARRRARARAGAAPARGDSPARRRRQHHPRRGRQAQGRLRGRVQEHLLLGGLRRLHGRPGAALRRRLGRDPLRLGRGRPGRHGRDPPGCTHRTGHRRRRAGAAGDGRGRLVRLRIGVADDVDGGGRRTRRLPCGARGAAAVAARSSAHPAQHRERRRSIPRPARSPGSAPVSFAVAAMRVVAEVDVDLGLASSGSAPLRTSARRSTARRRGSDRGWHRAGTRSGADGEIRTRDGLIDKRELHRLSDPDRARHAARDERADRAGRMRPTASRAWASRRPWSPPRRSCRHCAPRPAGSWRAIPVRPTTSLSRSSPTASAPAGRFDLRGHGLPPDDNCHRRQHDRRTHRDPPGDLLVQDDRAERDRDDGIDVGVRRHLADRSVLQQPDVRRVADQRAEDGTTSRGSSRSTTRPGRSPWRAGRTEAGRARRRASPAPLRRASRGIGNRPGDTSRPPRRPPSRRRERARSYSLRLRPDEDRDSNEADRDAGEGPQVRAVATGESQRHYEQRHRRDHEGGKPDRHLLLGDEEQRIRTG